MKFQKNLQNFEILYFSMAIKLSFENLWALPKIIQKA